MLQDSAKHLCICVHSNIFSDKLNFCRMNILIRNNLSHLQTECRAFPQHYIGQMHGEYCCFHKMTNLFQSISVYLSILFDCKNNYAFLY